MLLRAASEEPLRKKPGRTEYQRGIVTQHADGRLTVRTTGNQGSGVLSSMVQALEIAADDTMGTHLAPTRDNTHWDLHRDAPERPVRTRAT